MKFEILASLIASAAAFAPAQNAVSSTTALNAEMSKSLPFMLNPKNTAGYVGDTGFDPLGFSDNFDMKWLREAEIKHGRVSMLAALGFVAQEYVTLPGMINVDDSNMAPAAAGTSAMLQIVLYVGVLEFWMNKGQVTMETMFEGTDREPGSYGFDPLGLGSGKSAEAMEKLQLQEIKNGRLAMLAIGGMIQHNWVTGGALF
mmetsp:Transcript_6502/g.8450  ORF Transcript_6502/g.8450 Transcript_6502/m.8450 type:complete len:201 (+) Transcript_6502:172-774(+)|eukprot:CAMPEP_0198136838 /NCGR_PEP_ID=MMETSP1443-20131203/411_1 /TAXON_ID=186043 /ORGANISM="Entomoneis sp., Strain CCMP2396" /LENGTH=200 /DNA_ID=CAMNT_0043798117 /DNA_START=122 /DNA_END=724 /DNA_ORIENTATION=-